MQLLHWLPAEPAGDSVCRSGGWGEAAPVGWPVVPLVLWGLAAACPHRPTLAGFAQRPPEQRDGHGSRGMQPLALCPTDVDECLQSPPPCGSGRCENVPGGYRCLCPAGFRASLTENQCLGVQGKGAEGRCGGSTGAPLMGRLLPQILMSVQQQDCLVAPRGAASTRRAPSVASVPEGTRRRAQGAFPAWVSATH